MKFTVTVKTNARKTAVEKLSDGTLRVSVNVPPHEGRANKAVIEALADHLGVAKSSVKIVGGLKSRKKIIEVH